MMNRPKPVLCASLFFLVVLFALMPSFKLSSCMVENHIIHNNIRCPETEKQALLSFKQSLEDPFGLLSSWNNRSSEVNCCSWKGVVCNNFIGHVQQLRLGFQYSANYLSGKITHSLVNLTQLKYLDLSGNNFTGRIPSFIGSSLRSLRYLNLANAGFDGAVPHSIGNLSYLRTLYLEGSWGKDTNSLYANSLEWVSGLSKLEHLSMNTLNLSKAAANWAPVINSLPSLVALRFSSCSLGFLTDNMMNEVNVSFSLTFLDLSRNLSNLIFLDLGENFFQGPIPSFSNTTKLQFIDLSLNYFNSTIPDWLYYCTDLYFVDLISNILKGTISSAIANLSSLNVLDLSDNELSGNIPRQIASLCKLLILELDENKLQGELSDSFGNMSDCFVDSLQYLDLFGNQLSGAIPLNIGQFISLEELHLSYNKLNGNLPESLGQLFNLRTLNIRDNKLEGVVTESHFANLTKLENFDVSCNLQLTLKVNPNWIPPLQLKLLRLVMWNLGTKSIPSWLETQKNLYTLDLSSTGISGAIPKWIGGSGI